MSTFVHFRVCPAAAITSLTFQTLNGSSEPYETAESLRTSSLPLVEERGIAALKIGMLPTAELVLEVARLLAETDLPAPVIDPVFQSSSGYELMEKEAIEALVTELDAFGSFVDAEYPCSRSLDRTTNYRRRRDA